MICRETTIEEKYLETFQYVPHQRGLYVIINGETVGFDILSLEKVLPGTSSEAGEKLCHGCHPQRTSKRVRYLLRTKPRPS